MARNQLATASLVKIQTLSGLAYELGRSTLLLGDPRAFLSEVGIRIEGRTELGRVPAHALPLLDFPSEPLEKLLCRELRIVLDRLGMVVELL